MKENKNLVDDENLGGVSGGATGLKFYDKDGTLLKDVVVNDNDLSFLEKRSFAILKKGARVEMTEGLSDDKITHKLCIGENGHLCAPKIEN